MSESGIFVKDEVFTGNGLGKPSIPELIRVSSTNVPERKLFLAGNPPINLSENSGPGSSRSAAGSAAAPLAQNVAPIQPPSLAWQASVDLAMAKGQPVINTAWLANNETVAIVPALTSDGPTALSESAAIQSFLRQEQAATQAIIAALRLPQQAPARWAIAELQRFLQAAVPATTGPGVARAPSQTYIPAILQISLSKLPDAQTQINHILIPARGELRGWQRRVPTALLQASVRSVQRQLSQQENGEITAAGRQLGELLLQPVWPELQRQGINALLLSLDRGLQGLPFAALPAGNGLLVDQLAVTITPALALTDLRPEAAAGPPRRTLLAGARHFQQGLMPLAMAEQELRQLASLHPDSVVLFDQAFQTRALLAKTRERPVQILHLATHADFASDRAAGARIYTSDGELALSELGRQLRNGQPQPIGLFVLNACRTAVGDEQRELGISGLALQAGASSALGNLWFVDDAVTAAFSVQFHRLLQQGLRKDQALQRTQALFRMGQIKLRGSEIINDQGDVLISGLPASERARLASLAHPYYWAGAVLSGRPW
jgi:CHAT domain-containing protein